MIHSARAVPAALLALALGGCAAGEPARTAAVVRDSAGIQIVENAGPVRTEGVEWRLSEGPLVDIGVLEGAPEYQLYQVRGATRLSDGRIVVANGGSHELRFYDAQGRHLASVGRQGGGPGEFEGVGWLGRMPGDSLAVYDWRHRRLSIFSPDGGFVRSFPLTPPSDNAFPTPAGVFADGSLLVAGGRLFSTTQELKTGVSRDSSVYFRYDPTGVRLDSIGAFPGDEAYMEVIDRGFTVMTLPFARESDAAVTGDRLYIGASDHYSIGVHAPDGTLRRIIRRAHEPLPVTPEDIARYKEQRLGDAASDEWRKRLEKMLAEVPYHSTMPAFADLRADAAGNLWVSEYLRPGVEEARWSVYDGEGRWLGQVATPAGLTVREIGVDYVLGQWRDDFDVEHVQLWGLIKPALGESVALAPSASTPSPARP